MNILYRYTLALAFTRWALLLFIGLFLIHLGDLLSSSGDYVAALGAGRGKEVMTFFVLRFPSFLAAWLPVSAAAAALLTAWPLLNQGTLVALCAAGIPVRRAFASLLILALGIGVLGFALQDQVIPRLDPELKFVRGLVNGRTQKGQGVVHSLGWHDGNRFWCAQQSKPEEGRYEQIAVFTHEMTQQRGLLVMADALQWRNGDWWLVKPVVVDSFRQPIELQSTARLADVGLSLSVDSKTLVERLKPDRLRPSDELFAIGSENAWGYLMLRVCFGLLPVLCLMFALPGFIRMEGRNHMGMQLLRSLAWMAVPLIGYWVLSRILISNSTHVITGTAVVLGSLLSVAGWRWWTMRV